MSPRPARRTFRLPVVVLVVALAAGAVYLDRTAPEASGARARTTTAAGALQGPTVPRTDAVSTAWYCAEGTSTADGRADETVVIGNLSTANVDAAVTVMPGGGKPPVSKRVSVAGFGQGRVRIADILATPEPGVVVEVFGGPAVVEHVLSGNGDVAVGPCARDAAPDWYFAAGTTDKDAQQYLALFNPYGDDAIVDVTFLTDSGVQAPEAFQGYVVPRRSRVSLPVHDEVRRAGQVAAFVHARTGRVVAERTQRFDGSLGRYGIDVSLGATAPATKWVLPFGDAQPGSAESVALANFSLLPADVEVDVLVEGTAVATPQTLQVPGRSVTPIDVGSKAAVGTNYTVVVKSTRGQAVVAEMFFNRNGTGGVQGSGTAIGATGAARTWAFALGRTDDGSDARLVAFNPGPKPVTVELRAYTAGDPNSPHSAPAVAIPAGDRGDFDLGAQDIHPDQLFVVASDGPIVAGRELTAGGVSIATGIPFSP
ncbi:MAG TPA: DUF5719 family protein [Acidimicrobiia bacterium]|nr:DUF5719 family protein [Acidimicrobiia bacterium]